MSGHRVIPGLRYRDAAAAVDWLCEAFGFERHMVVPREDGNVAHAQLTTEGGMVMLGAGQGDSPYDELVQPPAANGGVCTQGIYIVVDDCDAHHDRAVAAGAEIVMPLESPEYGGRTYSARDPEGHIWNFGTYDPYA